MSVESTGILGIGTYLPEQIRKNDWWPESIVQTWRERMGARITRGRESEADELSDGAKKTLAAMAELAPDPFRGITERRVMAEGQLASDMATVAAAEALKAAQVKPAEIDLIMSVDLTPDYINLVSGCVVQKNLGIPEACFSINADAVCNSFQMQLTLADALIKTGRARRALLVQTSAITRLGQRDEPHSAWWGDGATAVVVGPVSKGKGLIAAAHRSDGTLHKALLCGVPGGRWFDASRAVAYSEDTRAARVTFLTVADRARQILGEALAQAGLSPGDVDFYASHQATRWMPKVTQEHAGLTRAKIVETFPWAGTVSAANLPLVLSVGQREGLVKDGDVVAMFSGGTGMTWSGTVLRWGN